MLKEDLPTALAAAGAAQACGCVTVRLGRLILHGRYVCKARKPDCPQCIVRDLCRYADKTVVAID